VLLDFLHRIVPVTKVGRALRGFLKRQPEGGEIVHDEIWQWLTVSGSKI